MARGSAQANRRTQAVPADRDYLPRRRVPRCYHDRFLAILNAGVFARADLLLTCNEQFHSKKLAYAAFGTHEIKLEEWDGELQAAYVGGLYGADTLTSYEAWRDRDDSREVLCRVRLHMHYVVSLLHEEPDAPEAIDRRWDLFEEMARVRLRASGLHDQIDSVMDDLASLAHEHYRPGTRSTTRSVHRTTAARKPRAEKRR